MGSGDRSIDPFVSPPENEETSPQKWQILYIDWYWFASPSTRILAGGWSSGFSSFFSCFIRGTGTVKTSLHLSQRWRLRQFIRTQQMNCLSMRCPEFTPLVNPQNDGHGRFESSKNPGTAAINVLLGDAAIVAGRNIRDRRWKGGWWKVSLVKNVMVLAMKAGMWPRNRNWCTNVKVLGGCHGTQPASKLTGPVLGVRYCNPSSTSPFMLMVNDGQEPLSISPQVM